MSQDEAGRVIVEAFNQAIERVGEFGAIQNWTELHRIGNCIEGLGLASAADEMMRKRAFLELVEAAREPAACLPQDASPACNDYEDFFRRTRFVPAEGTFDKLGRIVKADDEMISRFVSRMIVQEDDYSVEFRCGIRVRIEGRPV